MILERVPVGLPDLPPPGSAAEDDAFASLQAKLPDLWRNTWHDRHAEQTVVVLPSLTFPNDELTKIKGFSHYEERLLFLLILLAKPRTRMVFLTSQPINPSIIDYYLQLLPGVPFSHARQRLQMFSTHDVSVRPLTAKVLERPHLLTRIKRAISSTPNAHLTVFNSTPLEKRLAVALGIPLLGTDPKDQAYGTKSGARKLFKEIGVATPPGMEDLVTEDDIAAAIVELARSHPEMRRVVVKHNDGFSGEGNGIYPLAGLRKHLGGSDAAARQYVLDTLATDVRLQARGMPWNVYAARFADLGGVVEGFIEGGTKKSPSVQLRLTPVGDVEIISSHDQILGGLDGQTYMGCRFPARSAYRGLIHQAALKIGRTMASRGVVGRLSVDFLAITDEQSWQIQAIEINLRMGGTTHPFCTLQYLTHGEYHAETGRFETPGGHAKYYVASDNVEAPAYRGLLPEDLIDITTYSGLHYNSSMHTGTVFHMIGTLSEFGKMGVTCIGNSPGEAQRLYEHSLQTLDQEARTSRWMI
ncbi:MAG: peptide ligase PGM1-related protein [Candidatus Xenobia bacterium]